ncbi:hypothetical protein C362_04824 [Cryptococcus neoformans Bt1]|nr:hypothetical protein C362_04824 [Cryptococcus neoformans var. grubii Bt1]
MSHHFEHPLIDMTEVTAEIKERYGLPCGSPTLPITRRLSAQNQPPTKFSHRAAVAKAARAEMGIETLDHPSSSPDLNVIENIWYLLKTKVSAFPRVATSLGELWEQIQKAWDEIDLEHIRDLIDEMEQRRVAVWKAQGKSTKY